MGYSRCQWVRGRLPLLVGDDLRGLDRRRVERHLIGCPSCRQHQASLGEALGTLRTVAASPAGADAPSLWPALARQIRESRRPSPSPNFPFAFAFPPSWLRAALNLNPWPALGMGLGLGLLATVGISLGVRGTVTDAHVRIAANRLPIAPPRAVPPILVDVPPAPGPRREQPAPTEASVVEATTPPPRIDYDLEHGRPMPDPREVRDTKATY